MAERFYITHSLNEAWMVSDRTTRYVRVIPKNSVTGEEDYCICTKATTPEDEAYIRSYAIEANWDQFWHVLAAFLQAMGRKKEETERVFKVKIQ